MLAEAEQFSYARAVHLEAEASWRAARCTCARTRLGSVRGHVSSRHGLLRIPVPAVVSPSQTHATHDRGRRIRTSTRSFLRISTSSSTNSRPPGTTRSTWQTGAWRSRRSPAGLLTKPELYQKVSLTRRCRQMQVHGRSAACLTTRPSHPSPMSSLCEFTASSRTTWPTWRHHAVAASCIGAVAECAAPRQRLTSTSETVLVAAASQSTLCCERVMNRDSDSTHMVAQYTAMHARCALPLAPCAQKMKKGKRVEGKETEGGFCKIRT